MERKAMARIARANRSNPADGRLPSSDAKLKLNRLRHLRVRPTTKKRQAALIAEARAARKAEQERRRAALAERR
jgi:hypothetical protein